MLILMKKSPKFASSLIAENSSLQEILIINDMAEKHPELFGFLARKSEVKTEYKPGEEIQSLAALRREP